MLEIDGEFFEDPCERIRTSRRCIAMMVADMAVTQMALVMSQPLFLQNSVVGGIVDPNTYKGDIILQPKSDFKRGKKMAPDLLDMRLLDMYMEVKD